jgi:hypothetical protein
LNQQLPKDSSKKWIFDFKNTTTEKKTFRKNGGWRLKKPETSVNSTKDGHPFDFLFNPVPCLKKIWNHLPKY